MMKNSLKNQSLKKKRIDRHLEQVNLFAAGIDIGSQSCNSHTLQIVSGNEWNLISK
jgi:hypothetical protein